jgi:hypothetical protein
VFPGPGIGQFWFLRLGLSNPQYATVLSQLKSSPNAKLLDLGTCLGQDLRKLVVDGISPSQVFGCDIINGFESVGHEFFRDKSRFENRYITADIFDDASESPLVKTQKTWDIICIYMFLHIWNRDEQVRACRKILNLLSSKPGSCIIGSQTGSVNPREFPIGPPFAKMDEKKSVYRHSVETFREMWQEAISVEHLDLDMCIEYEQPCEVGSGKTFFHGDDSRRLVFMLKRY